MCLTFFQFGETGVSPFFRLVRHVSHLFQVGQGPTLAVFRYPEHPRFSNGIPDSPNQ